jgi:iron complex transport system substrate-binding protein
VRRGGLRGLALAGLGTAAVLWAIWQLHSTPMGAVPPGSRIEGEGFPKALIDQSGRRVSLARQPTRIVSATLATDEILLALVEPERLLAVTYLATDARISNAAERAAAVPHKIRADAEQILALRPDLVFVASYLRGEVVRLLQDAGLAVFQFREFDSIGAIQHNIRLVARAVGEEARAEALIAAMQARLQAVAAQRRPDAPRPRVLYWGAPGYTAGRGTSVDDIIRHAGGENAAAALGIVGFAPLSAEQALALNPEVVVGAADHPAPQPGPPAVLRHPAWQTVAAVRQQRVFTLPRRALSTISHHIVEGVEMLARLLHAEAPAQREAP